MEPSQQLLTPYLLHTGTASEAEEQANLWNSLTEWGTEPVTRLMRGRLRVDDSPLQHARKAVESFQKFASLWAERLAAMNAYTARGQGYCQHSVWYRQCDTCTRHNRGNTTHTNHLPYGEPHYCGMRCGGCGIKITADCPVGDLMINPEATANKCTAGGTHVRADEGYRLLADGILVPVRVCTVCHVNSIDGPTLWGIPDDNVNKIGQPF
jgi:hypothetical protein